jgi:2-methylisocitrate lyase-like PEP mutase family enzyme
MSQREKAEAFGALHEGEPFLIPNPWDAGAAPRLRASRSRSAGSTAP